MDVSIRDQVTRALAGASSGEESAVSQLLPLVYDEMRALAASFFREREPGHTLQPTALAHEAYVKLVSTPERTWESRAHFLAVAAKAMRQILADHARRKRAGKRGGEERRRVTLSGLRTPPGVESEIELVALDEAMTKLAEVYPEQAKVVEQRFLAGLTVDEVVLVLGIPKRTVERRWRMARAWLRRELEGA